MKFELFVATRYLFAKKKGVFDIITTIIGIAGVSVGVAALVTTLGVMTGFQSKIRQTIVGAQSHVSVEGFMPEGVYQENIERIESLPLVVGAAPEAYGLAMLNFQGRAMGMMLRGLAPEKEAKVNNLMDSFVTGSFEPNVTEGTPNSSLNVTPGLVLGSEIALKMRLYVGDDVILISPSSITGSAGLIPKMKKFKISGIIKTGYYEFDNAFAYAKLEHVTDFLGIARGATSVSVKLHDMEDADRAAAQIEQLLEYEYDVETFAQKHGTLYAALKLEKTMMFIILFLIIIVASLNIASNLILLGAEKLKDIGIMRSMGATPAQISKIFLWEGMMVGSAGILCGLLLAAVICWAISSFNIVELPADIYYFTKVPVKIKAWDIFCVVAGSYIICFLAALYPALKASRIKPADAIRYG